MTTKQRPQRQNNPASQSFSADAGMDIEFFTSKSGKLRDKLQEMVDKTKDLKVEFKFTDALKQFLTDYKDEDKDFVKMDVENMVNDIKNFTQTEARIYIVEKLAILDNNIMSSLGKKLKGVIGGVVSPKFSAQKFGDEPNQKYQLNRSKLDPIEMPLWLEYYLHNVHVLISFLFNQRSNADEIMQRLANFYMRDGNLVDQMLQSDKFTSEYKEELRRNGFTSFRGFSDQDFLKIISNMGASIPIQTQIKRSEFYRYREQNLPMFMFWLIPIVFYLMFPNEFDAIDAFEISLANGGIRQTFFKTFMTEDHLRTLVKDIEGEISAYKIELEKQYQKQKQPFIVNSYLGQPNAVRMPYNQTKKIKKIGKGDRDDALKFQEEEEEEVDQIALQTVDLQGAQIAYDEKYLLQKFKRELERGRQQFIQRLALSGQRMLSKKTATGASLLTKSQMKQVNDFLEMPDVTPNDIWNFYRLINSLENASSVFQGKELANEKVKHDLEYYMNVVDDDVINRTIESNPYIQQQKKISSDLSSEMKRRAENYNKTHASKSIGIVVDPSQPVLKIIKPDENSLRSSTGGLHEFFNEYANPNFAYPLMEQCTVTVPIYVEDKQNQSVRVGLYIISEAQDPDKIDPDNKDTYIYKSNMKSPGVSQQQYTWSISYNYPKVKSLVEQVCLFQPSEPNGQSSPIYLRRYYPVLYITGLNNAKQGILKIKYYCKLLYVPDMGSRLAILSRFLTDQALFSQIRSRIRFVAEKEREKQINKVKNAGAKTMGQLQSFYETSKKVKIY